MLTMPNGGQNVQPHWGNLESRLTRLKLNLDHEIGHATVSALNELTRLERLTLVGVKSMAGEFPIARIELCLPELEELMIGSFSHVSILLGCPFLEVLGLIGLYPLQALQGIPQDIGKVALTSLGEGSISPQEVFAGQELEDLRVLVIVGWGHIYQDSEALEVVKQVFRNGRLLSLTTDYPLEKLTPLQGSECALPISLRVLELHLPLERGVPVILERLTNLRKLTVYHIGEGPMHLDRPLDPFLNMAGFKRLIFSGRYMRQGRRPLDFTPDASKFLELAKKRIEEGGLLPYGRSVLLKYLGQE